MALIVEDGSCVSNAESYISVSDADMYLDNIGMTQWAGMTTVDKERALRRATIFMTARYRGSWKGAKVKYEQSLDWPRIGVNPDDDQPALPGIGAYYSYVLPYDKIPKEIQHCCADLALKAAAGPLVQDTTQKVLQETVGPITTKYDPNSPVQTQYSLTDMTLQPFLTGAGNKAMVKLGRR